MIYKLNTLDLLEKIQNYSAAYTQYVYDRYWVKLRYYLFELGAEPIETEKAFHKTMDAFSLLEREDNRTINYNMDLLLYCFSKAYFQTLLKSHVRTDVPFHLFADDFEVKPVLFRDNDHYASYASIIRDNLKRLDESSRMVQALYLLKVPEKKISAKLKIPLKNVSSFRNQCRKQLVGMIINDSRFHTVTTLKTGRQDKLPDQSEYTGQILDYLSYRPSKKKKEEFKLNFSEDPVFKDAVRINEAINVIWRSSLMVSQFEKDPAYETLYDRALKQMHDIVSIDEIFWEKEHKPELHHRDPEKVKADRELLEKIDQEVQEKEEKRKRRTLLWIAIPGTIALLASLIYNFLIR